MNPPPPGLLGRQKCTPSWYQGVAQPGCSGGNKSQPAAKNSRSMFLPSISSSQADRIRPVRCVEGGVCRSPICAMLSPTTGMGSIISAMRCRVCFTAHKFSRSRVRFFVFVLARVPVAGPPPQKFPQLPSAADIIMDLIFQELGK